MSNTEAEELFKAWLADLVKVFAEKHGLPPDDAQEYVWENYTEWRCYFDDGYSPAEAAHEDALCGADR